MKRQRRQRINLKDDERKTLQSLVQKHTAKQSVIVRAKIILLADEGMQHQEIAQELSIRNNTVTTWIARWRDLSNKSVEDRLQDSSRPGVPDKFTPEQLCQIFAIACSADAQIGSRQLNIWTLPRKPSYSVMKIASEGILEVNITPKQGLDLDEMIGGRHLSSK